MKFYIIISSLFISQAACCGENQWLAAGYIDTLNKLNIKGGVTFLETKTEDPEPFDFGAFKYADIELGIEGIKLTVGSGVNTRHGLDRIGVSYARMKSQDLIGVESVISNLGGSVKLGYYFGLNGTANCILVGFGFGF